VERPCLLPDPGPRVLRHPRARPSLLGVPPGLLHLRVHGARFIGASLSTHLGEGTFLVAGDPYLPFVHGVAVLLVMWLILLWMYRRRIFLQI